jgi:hypothetical protein
MKPHLRKTFLSSVILTIAFAVVILTATFVGFRDSRTLVICGSVVMAVAIMVAAGIWGKPPSDSDSGKHDS